MDRIVAIVFMDCPVFMFFITTAGLANVWQYVKLASLTEMYLQQIVKLWSSYHWRLYGNHTY